MRTFIQWLYVLIFSIAFHSAGVTAAESDDACATEQKRVSGHIAALEDFDLNVFSNQKWDELARTHSNDVVVHWPDGHTTRGLQKHVEDLKAVFIYAPDTKVRAHSIKFGQGEWVAFQSELEGTFTRMMPVKRGRKGAHAKPTPQTKKRFKVSLVTLSRWADGKIVEKHLVWDNQNFRKQLGLASE